MKKIYDIKHIIGILVLAAGGVFTACTETEFSQRPPELVRDTILVGQVDILFVVDNSGSMSTEQRRMADSFPNFVQGLDLAGMDYRIGIITTDVESGSNPPKDFGQGLRALQNGNLLQFPDGSFFLSPSTLNIESQFWATIQRQETLDLERSGFNLDPAPSGDERGIYAAYLTVNENKKNFFRPNGHASFIFLSDEDVRGGGLSNRQFRPEIFDYPATLIQVVRERLGENMTISAHAIVTESQSCLNQQNGQGGNSNIRGAIGEFYMTMTNPSNFSLLYGSGGSRLGDLAGGQLVRGVIGSICRSNYVSELGSIRNVLSQSKASEKLKCTLADETTLRLNLDRSFSYTLNAAKNEVSFTPPLPAGTSFEIEYECP